MTLDFGECAMSQAVQAVCDERERQKSVEGWTPDHDDQHDVGALAHAAGCYLLFGTDGNFPDNHPPIRYWPWDAEWWKPKDRKRNLERAGALVLAELERIYRQELREKSHASQEGIVS